MMKNWSNCGNWTFHFPNFTHCCSWKLLYNVEQQKNFLKFW